MAGALQGSSLLDDTTSNLSVGYSASVAGSQSYPAAPSSNTTAFTPPMSGGANGQPGMSPNQGGSGHHHGHSHGQASGSATGAQQRNPNLDYDQAGIDFVLTYDDPSKAYMSPNPP